MNKDNILILTLISVAGFVAVLTLDTWNTTGTQQELHIEAKEDRKAMKKEMQYNFDKRKEMEVKLDILWNEWNNKQLKQQTGEPKQ